MRRRFQKPKIKNKGGYWIAQYRDLQGTKRKVSLGPVTTTKKFEAEGKLTRILEPINCNAAEPESPFELGAFVRQVYLPFYGRKWKESTAHCNRARIGLHLLNEFEACLLTSFSRNLLQQYLDRKSAAGHSHSVVAHLRWDLRQIFRMALAEGYVTRNPAELLFIPREARRYPKPRLTVEQVQLLFSVLDLRERLISELAILAGMRPGEIFALQRCHVDHGYADIRQRIYAGKIDTPKTFNSRRRVGLSDGLIALLKMWLDKLSPEQDAWLFPSATGLTPIRNDNCWKKHFLPRLKAVGLQWANFQVMRRTHSTLMYELGVDPQVRADQMGHTVDVNQNQYTRASLARRRAAVNLLEKALEVV